MSLNFLSCLILYILVKCNPLGEKISMLKLICTILIEFSICHKLSTLISDLPFMSHCIFLLIITFLFNIEFNILMLCITYKIISIIKHIYLLHKQDNDFGTFKLPTDIVPPIFLVIAYTFLSSC